MKSKQFTIKRQSSMARAYRNFALGLFSFLVAFLVASTFAPAKTSDAAQLFSASYDATGYYVNVSGSSTIAIDVTGTIDGQLVGAKDTITTVTNSPRGYQLYISASPNYLYLDGAEDTTTSDKFSPIGGSLTSSMVLGANTWGFAYDNTNTGVAENNFPSASAYATSGNYSYPTDTATYTSIPTTDLMIQSHDSANLATDGTNLDIFFGLKANTQLTSGTYSGNITYTAISDGVNHNTEFMQDFTTEQCQALPVADADNYATAHIELMDRRDLKWYSVAHMKDGNCWMTSNLALDGGITLTPDDSNVTENRTLPASANIENGDPSEYDTPQIYTAIQDNTTTDCGSYAYCVESNVKYGNLYNWNAATATTGKQATTGTAYESVCPKGWRLPDNGTATGAKTWSNLLAAYSYPSDSVNAHGDSATSRYDADTYTYIKAMQVAPFNIPLSGDYSNTAESQVIGANLWTRTVRDGAVAYHFAFYLPGYFGPSGYHAKYYAFAVRCVFQGSTIENNMYMQDLTTTMCSNLAESTASSDNRRTVIDGRDGKTYRVSHLADGNCWMVQNLALDGNRTLQPTDSNVTENHTLFSNISNNTTTMTYTGQIYASGATTTDTHGSPYGNLYNYQAAVANTHYEGNISVATEDICPLHWHLPDVYNKLTGKYGLPTANVANLSAVQAIQQAPLYFPLAGGYSGTSRVTAGDGGSYWGRTPRGGDSLESIGLSFAAGNKLFYAYSNMKQYTGASVRCLLGE